MKTKIVLGLAAYLAVIWFTLPHIWNESVRWFYILESW